MIFRTFHHLVRACLLFAAGLFWAAAAPIPSGKADLPKTDTTKAGSTKADYVLQPSDLIRVQVFQEEDINKQGDVRISQEYTVTLPLIGSVDLRGKTARQAEEMIRALYDRDYLVNPQVNLIVLEYVPRNVFVSGSVGLQGVVPFPREQGLTLIDAISRAGGFNRLADKKHVTIKRTDAEGKTDTFIINAEDLMKGDSTETWPLQPNDVITVPERIL